jgi:hypothetical protein
MMKEFESFKKGKMGLEIWSDKDVLFSSKKSGLGGLLEFIDKKDDRSHNLVIFDKKVGNAVALICVWLKAKEVYGVVGSESAGETLKDNKIKFNFLKTISCMMNKDNTDLCPMEKLSLGKNADDFLSLLRDDR